jgi:hypothetical protein
MNIVGVKGNSGINPTLLMRIQDFAMVLTVINQDKVLHTLYVDGQDVNTIILKAGEIKQLHFIHQQKAHTITITVCPHQLNPWGR